MRPTFPVAWVMLAVAVMAVPAAAQPDAPLPGDPWGPEGLGGSFADLGAGLGGLVTSVATEGPASWVLERATVPSGSAGPFDGPALPEAPALAIPLLVLSGPAQPPGPSTPQAPDVPATPEAELDLDLDLDAASFDDFDGAVQRLVVVDAGALKLSLPLPAASLPDATETPATAARFPGHQGTSGADVAGRDAPAMPSHAGLAARDDAFAAAPLPPAASSGPAPAGAAAALPGAVAEAVAAAPATLLLLAAGFLLLAPMLYHRIQHESVLDQASRRALFDAVQASPGCTIEGASRATGIGRGTALHHLRILAKGGYLQMVRGTKEVHLFPCGARLDPVEAAQRALLARPRSRELSLHVAANPGLTRIELARAIGIAPSTVDWHITELFGRGLLEERVRAGRRELLASPALQAILDPGPGLVSAAAPERIPAQPA